MAQGSQFELHSFRGEDDWSDGSSSLQAEIDRLDWNEHELPTASVLVVDEDAPEADALFVGIAEDTKCPVRVAADEQPVAEFRTVQRRLGPALAMFPCHDGVLVNGLPALALTVLAPRDALVLAPGLQTYVTQRIRPYVGKATEEMIGKKCPFCRIPIDRDTRVVTCRCGVVYHLETDESHPDVDESDRLACFNKVRKCLSCSREVTFEESLVWGPAGL